MKREIQIHPEAVDVLRSEWIHAVDYLQAQGFVDCQVLFGFAWRTFPNDADLSWKQLRLPLTQLLAEIQRSEDSGLGALGRDDMWLTCEAHTLVFLFCHHHGVHLMFNEPGLDSEHYFSRWQAAGLSPLVRERTDAESIPNFTE